MTHNLRSGDPRKPKDREPEPQDYQGTGPIPSELSEREREALRQQEAERYARKEGIGRKFA